MVAPAEFCAEYAAFRLVAAPPASVRQQAAWQPVHWLPWRVAIVDVKSRVYTNQSEPGEAPTQSHGSGTEDRLPRHIHAPDQ